MDNNPSWRHHFVPQYYIQNFYGANNELWVYDKEYDKILNRPTVSKSIFFEPHRNSIFVNEELTPILEDYFKIIDDKHAKHLGDISLKDKLELEDSHDYIRTLTYFANWLLWRIPKYDKLTKDLIVNNFDEINKKYFQSRFSQSKIDDDTIKIIRTLLPYQLLVKYDIVVDLKFKIYEIEQPNFFLTDNPILIEEHPQLSNTISCPLLLPITPTKIFAVLSSDYYTFNLDLIIQMNFEFFHRANKFVASPSKEHLQNFINGYREYKEISDKQSSLCVKNLFENINKKT